MWCIGTLTGEYLARMEDVLSLYNLPYNANRPIICLDELPFQLLGEKVEPLKMKAGALKKFDYEYVRHGTAAVFVAFEPLTGKRLVRVYPRRTKADYCRFQQEVALTWATAEMIIEVQDNLNTHNASSFYENLPPAEAYALMKRFEMHYTPKKGSWLNMAELELSAISRQCLARRISDIETLSSELNELVKERNKLEIKAKWQFTVENAREKLNRHYEKVSSKD
jgi:DDE superfamily endonuclease